MVCSPGLLFEHPEWAKLRDVIDRCSQVFVDSAHDAQASGDPSGHGTRDCGCDSGSELLFGIWGYLAFAHGFKD